MNFSDFKMDYELKQAIERMGFEKPTPIQDMAIPLALDGRDIIGQAQTGTGKTIAFGIPILNKLFLDDKSPQAVVICPTRELSIQVSKELKRLAQYYKGLKILAVYGGQPIGRQIRVLKKGVHVVVGTPGRIMDHIRKGTLDLLGVGTIVLDEADEMLDMGFKEDIEKILNNVPKQRQTLLFSATFSKDIKKLTKKYQNNPEYLKISKKELTVKEVEQYYYEAREKQKLDTLTTLMNVYDLNLALVFCNTKRRVDTLTKDLKSRGYSVGGIHGDMRQEDRDKVMNKFRNGDLNILVATDVAARGINVPNVEAVFNYDLPRDNEVYVHRIGRTGRAGREGYAFTFVAGKEKYRIPDIEKYAKTEIVHQKVPSFKKMNEIKNNIIKNKVIYIMEHDNINDEIPVIEDLIKEGYNPIDIAGALLKLEKK